MKRIESSESTDSNDNDNDNNCGGIEDVPGRGQSVHDGAERRDSPSNKCPVSSDEALVPSIEEPAQDLAAFTPMDVSDPILPPKEPSPSVMQSPPTKKRRLDPAEDPESKPGDV